MRTASRLTSRIRPEGDEVDRRDRAVLQVEEGAVVTGGRRGAGGRARPRAGAALGRGGRARRDDGLLAADADHVHARLVPERALHRAGEPVDEPALAVVVVHREGAAGLEVLAGGPHGLRGEQVALQPQRAGSGHQGERVGQREQDEVVAAVGALQEGAPVGDVGGDARVVVRPVGVLRAAELAQFGIDLDGVDPAGALGQRDGHVGAAARAHDQHVLRGRHGPFVRQAVLALPLQAGGGGRGLLVRDAVDRDVGHRHAEDLQRPGGDLVVGRPDRARGERLGQQQADDGERGQGHQREVRHARPGHQQQPVGEGGDQPPEDGRRAEEGQRGEGGDAGEAADQVVAVGLQPGQLGEAPADQLGGPHEHHGRRAEDHRQDQPGGRAGGAEAGPVEDVLGGAVHRHGEREHDEHEAEQHDRRVIGLPRGSADAQESESDAEERAEQHEIGEITQMDDVGSGPPDQRELEEEHEGTGEDQSGAHRQPVRARAAADRLLLLERHDDSPY